MASTELTPTKPTTVVEAGEPEDGNQAGPLIRRPAELVELAELVYRGVFSAGLLVASILTLYATALGALQPRQHRVVGIAVCALLLVGQLVATHQRRRLYPLLRRQAWLVLLPASAIGIGAWTAGAHNQQLFFVLAVLLSVLGAAVPLRWLGAASLVAAAGLAAPHITNGSWTIGVAVAAGILPPLFWLVIDQLVRFMLRLHQKLDQPSHRRPKRVRAWVERQWHAYPMPPASETEPQADEAPEVNHAEVPQARDVDLTARQLEVLLLCAEGLSNGEIGRCLEIGAVQVGRHLGNACDRAEVATNAELVAWAIDRDLIPPSEAA